MGGRIPWALLCLLLAGLCDMFDGKIALPKRPDLQKRNAWRADRFSQRPHLLRRTARCHGLRCRLAAHLYAALAAGLYVLAALIRLAWFNVDEEERQG